MSCKADAELEFYPNGQPHAELNRPSTSIPRRPTHSLLSLLNQDKLTQFAWIHSPSRQA